MEHSKERGCITRIPSRNISIEGRFIQKRVVESGHIVHIPAWHGPYPELSPQVVKRPVTGCSARQFEMFVSNVVCEDGSDVKGVTPSDKNCPAAGVAMNAKRTKINDMTRRERYWGNKKDISPIILRVSPSSEDGFKARMAVGPRATGNVRPLMRA